MTESSGRSLQSRALEIAARVLERSPGEWPSLLDTACGGDEQLRHQVERLLEAGREAADSPESAGGKPSSLHDGATTPLLREAPAAAPPTGRGWPPVR